MKATTTQTSRLGGKHVAGIGLALGALCVNSLTGAVVAEAATNAQAQEWQLETMRAEKIWQVSTGKDISVAVIDSGVNGQTSSLRGKVTAPKSAGSGALRDYAGHGTTISEYIAGTGKGGGIKGIAPDAMITPYRVPTADTPKSELKDTVKMAEAIRAAADSDAKIINISIEGDTWLASNEEAIKYALAKGKLIFAGVGNDAEKKNDIGYPARYSGVVGVGSTDKSGQAAKFSEHGDYVDLAAAGKNLPEWCDNKFTKYCSGAEGTSMSTAIASGSAALIWSKHPDWTSNQVLKVLIDTAGRTWKPTERSEYLGQGIVRPSFNILENKGDPGPADVDPISGEKVPGWTGGAGEDGAKGSESSPSAGTKPSNDSVNESESGNGQDQASDEKTSDSDSNTALWIGLGAAVVVLAVGGGVFAMRRSQRG